MYSAAQAGANPENGAQKVIDTTQALLDYKKPEFYLKNLPLNDSLLAISNEKIANAYLNAGKAYSEKIIDLLKASESFENLITRYPSHELVPEALYNLFRVNSTINNSKSETYRQRLLEKYPSTEFARILSDPDYYEKKMAEMKMAENLYEAAYRTYSEENFTYAISLCDEALTKYSQNTLAPKFQLLRSYSVARISDERTFKEELNKLIKTWPRAKRARKQKRSLHSLIRNSLN